MFFRSLKRKKEKISQVLVKPFFGWSFVGSFLVVILLILLPVIRLWPASSNLTVYIPLHYNVFFGVDSFGPWYAVFVLPALGLFLLLLNFWLVFFFFERVKFLAKFFTISTIVIEIILLVAEVFIILLNL